MGRAKRQEVVTNAAGEPVVVDVRPEAIVPEVGKIVLFVLDQGPFAGQIRPALVISVNELDGTANLALFVDFSAGGDRYGATTSFPVKRGVRAGDDLADPRGCWVTQKATARSSEPVVAAPAEPSAPAA